MDVLRAATEPMTALEIGAAILKAHGVEDASKEDVQTVAQGIQHTLKNREGNGVQRPTRGYRRDGSSPIQPRLS